jgi:hypothetical protein
MVRPNRDTKGAELEEKFGCFAAGRGHDDEFGGGLGQPFGE